MPSVATVAVNGRFPYLMYDAVNDSRTRRPQHLEWDGLILPIDHPFWQTHGSPNELRALTGLSGHSEKADRSGVLERSLGSFGGHSPHTIPLSARASPLFLSCRFPVRGDRESPANPRESERFRVANDPDCPIIAVISLFFPDTQRNGQRPVRSGLRPPPSRPANLYRDETRASFPYSFRGFAEVGCNTRRAEVRNGPHYRPRSRISISGGSGCTDGFLGGVPFTLQWPPIAVLGGQDGPKASWKGIRELGLIKDDDV